MKATVHIMPTVAGNPGPLICEGGKGNILPLGGKWEQDWPNDLKVIMYLLGLLYCFVGVAIISDIFMSAIERITSKKKLVLDKKTNRMITVLTWNPTVANLTLMALGSSAPEILLSCIELMTGEFYSGELGPSTIVGSAAFNLLCITAVCISAIPGGEVRKIKDTKVFAVTAGCSIFAYVWLLVILLLVSSDKVEIWEGLVTFLFFPVLVLLAWLADIGFFSRKAKPRQKRRTLMDGVSKEDVAMMRAEIQRMYGCRADLTEERLLHLMHSEFSAPVSRATYRVIATRELFKGKAVGTGSVVGLSDGCCSSKSILSMSTEACSSEGAAPMIFFPGGVYMVMESVGTVNVVVRRTGDNSSVSTVKYKSRDGSAKEGGDYVKAEGTLEFAPNEVTKYIEVQVIDDTVHEQTEDFYLDLFDAGDNAVICKEKQTATIIIIDDDMPGVLSFEKAQIDVFEIEGAEVKLPIVVNRKNGGNGKVSCSYRTEEDNALADLDYVPIEGKVEFQHGQMSVELEVIIKPKGRYENTERFRVILEDPEGTTFDESGDGGKDHTICTVFIKPSPGTKDMVDTMMRTMKVNWDRTLVGNAKWKDQFIEAIHVRGSPAEQEKARIHDWIMHLASVPWKIIFAAVPPTEFAGGWVCFFVALGMIGLLTAVIGDMANLLGCAMKINASTTAITFVALGTSLPDTFASKSAAQQDPYADASIGNVTGSNSVNVFLGLGLPWLIGAVYWHIKGATPEWQAKYPDMVETYPDGGFIVKAGSLGFNVAVFSCCAVASIVLLVVRRKVCGGELGGNKIGAFSSSAGLFLLWISYIVACILKG
mmetsp:Transcript_112646/g.318199  ORF Transcript_112646/g.318199 Transcript_112646/m.318199 type:complete len:821 (-) Transcript_112646:68-2530(-)